MSDLVGVQAANDEQHAALYDTILEVARRRSEDLQGIIEILSDNVIVNIGRRRGGTLGYFAPESWDVDGIPVSEVVLLARRESTRTSVSLGEDVLTTLIHELAHVYAHYTGVKDTSNAGKWHNRRFGEIALALGLQVERSGDYRGITTPGISPSFLDEYADLVAMLDDALTVRPARPRQVRRAPAPPAGVDASVVGNGFEARPAKYLFLACNCRAGNGSARTIRVARGSWVEGAIQCLICNSPFIVSESLTLVGQESGTHR